MNTAFELLGKSFLTQNLILDQNLDEQGGKRAKNIRKIEKKIQKLSAKAKNDTKKLERSIQAFFIGPRGENMEFFKYLIGKAIDSHLSARVEYEIEDTRHITRKMKVQPSFLDAQDRLERALNQVLARQKQLTPPFFSSRYFGHMIWQTTIPSIVGNFATLLYNPNNCSFEASPYTTFLEIDVMKQFAIMFNYPSFLTPEMDPEEDHSWGHLTCGGTISNTEALWAARNCKFLALALRKYIEELRNPSEEIKAVAVSLANNQKKELLQLNSWELLNIPSDQALVLSNSIFQLKFPEYALLSNLEQRKEEILGNYIKFHKELQKYTVSEVGLAEIYRWLEDIDQNKQNNKWPKGRIPAPKVFVSATAHYSIEKALSLLGFGKRTLEKVHVDQDTRLCVNKLREKLQYCLDNHVPVLSVIGIVGTTEQSSVDPLDQIVKLREEFATKGLYFHFHVDGAYGGYFASMVSQKESDQWNSISEFVDRQLRVIHKADSITFDPHKTGYVPYTCGGIIYRNHRLRDSLAFSAPVIYSGAEPNMAIYGIQGSKPGCAVTSVYLSLQVLPLVRAGHGELLERTVMNTKIFVASLYRLSEIDVKFNGLKHGAKIALHQRFQCLMLCRHHYEKTGNIGQKEAEQKAIKRISEFNPSMMESFLIENKIEDIYRNLGPDFNIPCYGINFRNNDGSRNTSLQRYSVFLLSYNKFNKELIKLSKPIGTDTKVKLKELFVSQTVIRKVQYGDVIFNDFLNRHNLQADGEDSIVVIRSTIMNAFFTELSSGNNVCESSNRVFIEELLENACETLLALNLR